MWCILVTLAHYETDILSSPQRSGGVAGRDSSRGNSYLPARLGRLLSDESGQSAMIVVVIIGLFLLGFLALGIDVGFLFHEQQMAQSAADAAAVAAAEEMSSSNQGNEQAVANAMAKLNGFDPGASINPATVTLSTPSGGSYTGSSSYVQAVVSKPIPTFFLAAVAPSIATMTISSAGSGRRRAKQSHLRVP